MWPAADQHDVELDGAAQTLDRSGQHPDGMNEPPAGRVGCDMPMASARRGDEMTSSEWRIIHVAIRHLLRGGLVECSGVQVVAVN